MCNSLRCNARVTSSLEANWTNASLYIVALSTMKWTPCAPLKTLKFAKNRAKLFFVKVHGTCSTRTTCNDSHSDSWYGRAINLESRVVNCSCELRNTLICLFWILLLSFATLPNANSTSSIVSNITNASPLNWCALLWIKCTSVTDRPIWWNGMRMNVKYPRSRAFQTVNLHQPLKNCRISWARHSSGNSWRRITRWFSGYNGWFIKSLNSSKLAVPTAK